MEMIYFRVSGLPSNDSRNDKRNDKRTEDESVGLLFVTVFLFLKSLFFSFGGGVFTSVRRFFDEDLGFHRKYLVLAFGFCREGGSTNIGVCGPKGFILALLV